MTNLLPLFTANLLPILLTAGFGFLLSRYVEIDPKTVSRITFYLFSPALIFVSLSKSTLELDALLQITGYAFATNILVGLIGFGLARSFRLPTKLTIAVALTTFVTNAGNFGMSLNQFAFGDETLAYASIYFVCSSIMINTIGVSVASMGKAPVKEAVLNVLKFPAIYALALGIIFNLTGWQLPLPVDRSLTQLSGAAIPAMLILLGMQLGKVNLKENKGPVGLAVGVRLLVSPVVALAMASLFQLQGPAYQAGVTEASMPTAVMTTVLATEFEIEPALISTVVTMTTLLSPLTLTPLLAYLGAG